MSKDDQHSISHSMARYLLAIKKQLNEKGYARVTDIATRLDISKSSASVALSSLREKGYLTEDKNHFFKLTEEGNSIASRVYNNQILLETFLQRIVRVSHENALLDSNKIEHLISEETSQKLYCLVCFLLEHNQELNEFHQKLDQYSEHCPHLTSCEMGKFGEECPFPERDD